MSVAGADARVSFPSVSSYLAAGPAALLKKTALNEVHHAPIANSLELPMIAIHGVD